MARPLRIEYPDAIYHIISRGTRKDNIYLENKDKEKFLKKLKETKTKYNLEIFSYCLMDNHFHLLIRTPLGNLSKAMHYLNTSYTNWFKAKHDIVGPIFQGRYKSILVEDESYLLTLSSYIHLNPLRAEIVEYLEDYKYNSFNDYINKNETKLVDKNFLLSKFENIERFKEFIYEWYEQNKDLQQGEDNKKLRNRIYGVNGLLGSKGFVEKIIKKIEHDDNKNDFYEYSNVDYLIYKKEDIERIMVDSFDIDKEILYKKSYSNDYKNLFIYLLKKYTDMKLADIGNLFKIKYSTVSVKTRRFEKKCKVNRGLKKKLKTVENKIIKKK
ncbi:MAG TPA: transposase [Candidatus Mcinerneyibacterium sp.]|nr:transposase [Candidatus Mcinerneyibacterium sp.]